VQAGLAAEFVEAGVYEAVKAVDARAFDVVYTSIGAFIWLPDITRRASTVAELLAARAPLCAAGRSAKVITQRHMHLPKPLQSPLLRSRFGASADA
jgi:hypothetical protein